MRTVLVYTAGLATAIAPTVVSGVLWGTRKTHIMQVFPQRGVDAWSWASVLIAVAAFVAAVALPLSLVTTFGFRKEWPTKSFALGVISGVAVGALVDVWCYHLMHSA